MRARVSDPSPGSGQRLQRTAARLHDRGMTLVELSITLALAGVLVAMVAPSMVDFARNARLREGSSTVMTAVHFARSEAIRRNQTLRLTLADGRLALLAPEGQLLREDSLPGSVVAALQTPDGTAVDPPTVQFGGSGRTVPNGAAFRVDVFLAGTPCDEALRCRFVMIRPGGSARLCRAQEAC